MYINPCSCLFKARGMKFYDHRCNSDRPLKFVERNTETDGVLSRCNFWNVFGIIKTMWYLDFVGILLQKTCDFCPEVLIWTSTSLNWLFIETSRHIHFVVTYTCDVIGFFGPVEYDVIGRVVDGRMLGMTESGASVISAPRTASYKGKGNIKVSV